MNKIINLIQKTNSIESNLLPFINETILAEVVLNNITNIHEGIEFIFKTFLYIRMK